MRGTVLRVRGGVYRIALDEGGRVDASIRGRLKLEERTGDRVVIGDRVRVAVVEGAGGATIEEVFPRDREIVRRGPGGRRPKVVAANVDRMVIVVAAASPPAREEQVDRLLVVAEANRLEPVLVVNKVDLEGGEGRAEELAATYGRIGYRVLRTSARTGAGVEELRTLVCRGTSALVGPSGAGKSSLLNAVEPGLGLRTGELSRKPRAGRHTTVSARMIELGCGGWVADTPGFSDVGLWGVAPDELEGCFPDLSAMAGSCRFRGCTHVHEPGCAVREAVERNEIDRRRYERYVRFRSEARDASGPPWKR